MEYVITVAKKETEGDVKQIYQQIMGEEFKIKKLILALNSLRKTGIKKEKGE